MSTELKPCQACDAANARLHEYHATCNELVERNSALAREVHELRICTPLEYQQKADRRLAERGVNPDPLWESHGRLLEATRQMKDHFRQDPAMDGNGAIWFNRHPSDHLKDAYREWNEAITAAEQLTKGDA